MDLSKCVCTAHFNRFLKCSIRAKSICARWWRSKSAYTSHTPLPLLATHIEFNMLFSAIMIFFPPLFPTLFSLLSLIGSAFFVLIGVIYIWSVWTPEGSVAVRLCHVWLQCSNPQVSSFVAMVPMPNWPASPCQCLSPLKGDIFLVLFFFFFWNLLAKVAYVPVFFLFFVHTNRYISFKRLGVGKNTFYACHRLRVLFIIFTNIYSVACRLND